MLVGRCQSEKTGRYLPSEDSRTKPTRWSPLLVAIDKFKWRDGDSCQGSFFLLPVQQVFTRNMYLCATGIYVHATGIYVHATGIYMCNIYLPTGDRAYKAHWYTSQHSSVLIIANGEMGMTVNDILKCATDLLHVILCIYV